MEIIERAFQLISCLAHVIPYKVASLFWFFSIAASSSEQEK